MPKKKILLTLFLPATLIIVALLSLTYIYFRGVTKSQSPVPSHASGDTSNVINDPNLGGAITQIDFNNENIVDTTDCGRLFQFAAFDGTRRLPEELRCGQSLQGDVWNPTQACGGSNCSSANVSDGHTITPVLWGSRDNKGDISLTQSIKNVGRNLWLIDATVNLTDNNYGTKPGKDYYALYGGWLKPQFSDFVSYSGSKPFTNANAEIIKASSRKDCHVNADNPRSTEGWAGLINPETGKGLILIDPSAGNRSTSWQYWPNTSCTGNNVISFPGFYPNRVHKKYYLFLGTWQEGRQMAYQLIPHSSPTVTPKPSSTPTETPIPSENPTATPTPEGTPLPEGATCPNENEPKCYDCNKDREINILDFACFRNAFNKQTT